MTRLYIPHFNQMPEDDVRAFVAGVGVAQVVTVADDGTPDATLLPVLWDGDRLLGHFARANRHWQRITDGAPALAVVTGPDAYVSPGWYASKREHGKVVPTWNYSAVHLRGTATVHEDAGFLRDVVTRLTEAHEATRAEPWAVTDAPADYLTKQLRAIVGVELRVAEVEAKAKLSQNRSDDDRAGVASGIAGTGRDPEGLVAR